MAPGLEVLWKPQAGMTRAFCLIAFHSEAGRDVLSSAFTKSCLDLVGSEASSIPAILRAKFPFAII